MNVYCHLKKSNDRLTVLIASAILLLPWRAWDRWIFVHSPLTVCLLELAKMASEWNGECTLNLF